MPQLTDIDRHDIQYYGMTHEATASSGFVSDDTDKEWRAAEYRKHLERMRTDDDYRYDFEENERVWEEKRKQNYYY